MNDDDHRLSFYVHAQLPMTVITNVELNISNVSHQDYFMIYSKPIEQ
jgi:hypothetical protein